MSPRLPSRSGSSGSPHPQESLPAHPREPPPPGTSGSPIPPGPQGAPRLPAPGPQGALTPWDFRVSPLPARPLGPQGSPTTPGPQGAPACPPPDDLRWSPPQGPQGEPTCPGTQEPLREGQAAWPVGLGPRCWPGRCAPGPARGCGCLLSRAPAWPSGAGALGFGPPAPATPLHPQSRLSMLSRRSPGRGLTRPFSASVSRHPPPPSLQRRTST